MTYGRLQRLAAQSQGRKARRTLTAPCFTCGGSARSGSVGTQRHRREYGRRPCSWLSMKNGALGGALLVHAGDGDGASSPGDLGSHKVVRCTGTPRTLLRTYSGSLPAPARRRCICRCHFAWAARCEASTQAHSSTSATRRRQRSSRRAYSSTRMGAPARGPQPMASPCLPCERHRGLPTYQLAQSTADACAAA